MKKWKKSIDKKILENTKWVIYKYLAKDKYKIFLFWSRVSNNFKNNSDYDIGIEWSEKIDFNVLMLIRSEIKEIPALIDIIDFHRVSDDFKIIAKQNVVYL